MKTKTQSSISSYLNQMNPGFYKGIYKNDLAAKNQSDKKIHFN